MLIMPLKNAPLSAPVLPVGGFTEEWTSPAFGVNFGGPLTLSCGGDVTSTMAIDRENDRSWYARGTLLSNQNRFEEAVVCYNVALENNPGDACTWKRKGFALLKLERYKEAADAFTEALSIEPEDATLWQRRCFALGKLGRLDEAYESCRRAILLNPAYITALHSEGWILSMQGRYLEALDCYDRILEIEPDREMARQARERILGEMALDHLQTFVAEAEKDLEIPEAVYSILRERDYRQIGRAVDMLRDLLDGPDGSP